MSFDAGLSELYGQKILGRTASLEELLSLEELRAGSLPQSSKSVGRVGRFSFEDYGVENTELKIQSKAEDS